jgi:signal transduction histidine kinase
MKTALRLQQQATARWSVHLSFGAFVIASGKRRPRNDGKTRVPPGANAPLVGQKVAVLERDGIIVGSQDSFKETMETQILIVDDSPVVVDTLTQILRSQGYGVESRSDGKGCWDRLVAGAEGAEPAPDLLLLDLNMPGIDGLTLLRRIRADERFALMPVIILTAETDSDTRLLALESGANDYLSKPVQTVELLARVKTLIDWKLAERLQQRKMVHLVEAGQVLMSTLDMDSVLQRVLQIATVEMNTEGTSIWLRNPDESLECRAAFGHPAERLLGIRIDPGRGVAGWVLQHRRSILVPDAQTDPRLYRKVDQQVKFRTRDLVAVPLVVRGAAIGVLEATNKKQGALSPADLAWLEVLAPIAAAAIANARLFQALRQRSVQLQAHNEELDAFADTVAHDLKIPLSSVIGFAETLEEIHAELPGEELRRYLHLIARGGRKISNIVDELLLLSRVRKAEVELKPLDMAGIVTEATQRLAGMIEESQAEIIMPEDWPVALGHGPWVEEVWVNYVSNALKYGGRPPRVELGFGTHVARPGSPQSQIGNGRTIPDGKICFWVRDNGPGLAADARAQLFTPFTRLERDRAEGHGLGLSIVQRIVDKLGGQVWVESEVGHGSLFAFTLTSVSGV